MNQNIKFNHRSPYQKIFEITCADIILSLVRGEQPQLAYHLLALLQRLTALPHSVLRSNQNISNLEEKRTAWPNLLTSVPDRRLIQMPLDESSELVRIGLGVTSPPFCIHPSVKLSESKPPELYGIPNLENFRVWRFGEEIWGKVSSRRRLEAAPVEKWKIEPRPDGLNVEFLYTADDSWNVWLFDHLSFVLTQNVGWFSHVAKQLITDQF